MGQTSGQVTIGLKRKTSGQRIAEGETAGHNRQATWVTSHDRSLVTKNHRSSYQKVTVMLQVMTGHTRHSPTELKVHGRRR